MQAGTDHEHAEAESPDPETQEPQPAAASGRITESEPGPIKIQSAQADTKTFRRFLAGLFGAEVEGISGEIEGSSPAKETSSDSGTEHSTHVTAPGEPVSEIHTEEVQPTSNPRRESVNAEAVSWPRKPPPEDEDWDYPLFRTTWAGTDNVETHLAASSTIVRARVVFSERISGVRQLARRMMDSLQVQRRWVIFAMVLLFVAAIPIAFLSVADGDLSSLVRFVSEIIPRNGPAGAGNANSVGRQETPTHDPNDGTRTPGTDFAGAYILSVEHLSADSSMLKIRVPAGVEGSYQAVVTVSDVLEYKCTFLSHYTDRLYCIGPLLPAMREINIRIFGIDEVDGSQNLVFETNYTTGEFGPLATPSPVFPIYGGAFTWPDRFDQVEIRNKQQSSTILAPLSALLSVALLLMYRMLSQGEHRLNRLQVESHDIGPLH